jgi:hypothetical protein
VATEAAEPIARFDIADALDPGAVLVSVLEGECTDHIGFDKHKKAANKRTISAKVTAPRQ